MQIQLTLYHQQMGSVMYLGLPATPLGLFDSFLFSLKQCNVMTTCKPSFCLALLG